MSDVSYEERLGEAAPGDEAFKRLSLGLQFVCREVPIRIADNDTDKYLIGFGYGGKPP